MTAESESGRAGRVVSPEEAARLGLPQLGPEELAVARDAGESFFASILNLGALMRRPLNATSLRTELSLADRLTLLRVAELLEAHGLQARVLRGDLGLLSRQERPAALVVGGRLCVLLEVSRGCAYLLDPARGTVALSRRELAGAWDGALLEVQPLRMDAAAGPAPFRASVLGLVLRYRPSLLTLFGLSLGGFALSLVAPRFSQAILDQALRMKDPGTLAACAAGLAIATLFSVGATLARQWVLSELTFRLDFRFSAELYRHALSLPARFFSGRRAGSMLARLMELQAVRELLSAGSLQAIADLLSVSLFGAVLALYSWKIALIPAAALPVMLAIQYAMRGRLVRNHGRAFDASAVATSRLTEQIAAIATVKALGAERTMAGRWEESFLERAVALQRASLDTTAVQGLTGFISGLMTIAGLWAAASLAMAGELTIGQVFAVMLYLETLAAPVGNLAGLASKLERVKVAMRKVSEVLEVSPEEPPDRASTTYSLPLKGKIRFEDVSFRYDERSPWVLRNVSFTISPRQVVAVVGQSGSGKTTLANLISGALRPTSGRIFFDDFDSAFLSLSALRRQLGFITQQRDLFAGTLLDNVAYADDAPDPSNVERACRDAGAEGFIRALPAAYGHYLGEGGLGLSGGEAQRLAIARTLYRRPKILLMDEATSALDLDSERRVLANLRELFAGKTTVIIAHRRSTIRHADRVLVLRDGELVEQGTHEELLAAGAHYAELFPPVSAGPEASEWPAGELE